MNQGPENFRDLQRLLSWKRHEQPPPGYFNDLSARIIFRLETANRTQASWSWTSWFRNFDAKPILICAYGLAVGGTLLFGFSFFGMGEGSAPSLSGTSGLWLSEGQIVPSQLKNDLSPLRNFDQNSGASAIIPTVARGIDVPTFVFDGSRLQAQEVAYPFRNP